MNKKKLSILIATAIMVNNVSSSIVLADEINNDDIVIVEQEIKNEEVEQDNQEETSELVEETTIVEETPVLQEESDIKNNNEVNVEIDALEGASIGSRALEFNGVSIDKNEAKVGDVVTISVDVKSNESEITEVTYNYSVAGSYPMIKLEYNNESGKYEGEIEITKDMEYATIESSRLYMVDESGTSKSLYSDELQHIKVSVLGQDGTLDEKAPTFNGISFDKNFAGLNEKIKVSVNASDDKSGITEVSYSFTINNDTNRSIDLTYNETTKMYEGEIDLSKYSSYFEFGGQIVPVSIDIKDRVGNYTRVKSNNLKDNIVYVNVKEGEVDKKSPQYISSYVDKNEANFGETVKVVVDASDESGIKSMEYTYYVNTMSYGGYTIETINLTYNNTTNKFEGEIEIDEDLKCKYLKPQRLVILDNLGNKTVVEDYDLDHLKVTAKDENGFMDGDAPELKSISVDKSNVKVGDVVTISADIEDVSGVRIARLLYEYGKGFKAVELDYNKDTKKYEYKFEISSEFEGLRLIPTQLILVDELDNTKFTGESYLESTMIIVENSNGNIADKVAPKFNKISVDKNIAAVGDKIKVYVDAVDEGSGIEDIDILYYVGDYGYEYNSFSYGYSSVQKIEYNQSTGMYEGYIEIPEESEYKTIVPNEIAITDKSGNITIVPANKLLDGKVQVKSKNGEINESKAIIKNASLDKKLYEVGDIAKISITMEEAIDDSYRLVVNYKDKKIEEYGKMFASNGQIYLKYNRATKSYVGEVKINEFLKDSKFEIDYVSAINKETGDYYILSNNDFDVSKLTIKTLKENTKPEIKVESDAIKINFGNVFNPLKGVTATDIEDGDLTSKIKVVENTVNTKVAGEYKVVYEVTDNNGEKVTKTVTVVVEAVPSTDKEIEDQITDKVENGDAEDNTIVVVPSQSEDKKEVVLTENVIASLIENNLELEINDGVTSISLDSETLKELNEKNVDGQPISITIESVSKETIGSLGDKVTALASIKLTSSSAVESIDGEIVVKLKVNKVTRSLGEKLYVYGIKNGESVLIAEDVEVDSEGYITFATNYLGEIVVVNEKLEIEEDKEDEVVPPKDEEDKDNDGVVPPTEEEDKEDEDKLPQTGTPISSNGLLFAGIISTALGVLGLKRKK